MGLKRVRALGLGFFFLRHRDLRLPSTMRIEGERRPISVPPDDWAVPGIFAEVLLEDVYRLRRGSGDLRSIVDVGANVGAFALAARRANHQAEIHAYEPNAALEPYLAVQCRSARATFFLEAVAGDAAGRALEESNSSSGYTRTVPGTDVPSVTLATVVERIGGRIDLLKLDCEGAEWELFPDQEPWAAVGAIAMEYHLSPGRTAELLRETIEGLGYRVSEFRRLDDATGMLVASR
jgi:FkbM family methyltransferase